VRPRTSIRGKAVEYF